MQLTSESFKDQGRLDDRFAFASSDPVGNTTPLPNRNPQLHPLAAGKFLQKSKRSAIRQAMPLSQQNSNRTAGA